MNRQEKFKQERVLYRKFKVTLFLCCLLVAAGICAVDYSTGLLLKNKAEVSIVSVKSEDTRLVLSILNEKIYLNTQYIQRDFNRLCKIFGG